MLRANTGLAVQDNGALLAALLADVVGAWPVAGGPGRTGGPLDGGPGRPGRLRDRRRRAGVVVAAGHRRGHHRDAPPRCAPRGMGAERVGRPGPAAGDLGVRPDPRPALGGHRSTSNAVSTSTRRRPCRTRGCGSSPARSAVRAHRSGRLATRALGDLLVRQASATGGGRLFPDADLLHVAGADHFGLLNHPDVRRALLDWLGP